MVIDNIKFYDKEGFPFEFTKKKTDDGKEYNYTEVYLQPLSVSLYDSLNIFLLEEFSDGFYFPQLEDGESIEFKWNDLTEEDEEENFFLFDVLTDVETKYPYIEPKKKDVLSYENDKRYFKRIPGTKVGKVPYQLNIAFTPSEEVIYERTLNIYYNTADGDKILCWQFYFYGEGLEEDDRFRVHIENFGIKFNRTDSLCLKDYNINEALPDWEQINAIRKELVVNQEEIFPYVGTYYGLKNFISLLGYNDVLDVKEYWEDIRKSSLYNGKYIITSVSSMLEDGEINDFNVLGENKSVKNSEYFRKTGFLALCYEFTRKTGEYDENECPIIERTTEFTSNEMFYKLHKLKKLLQKQFLPVNVQIKDVIGEYTYYISFAKIVWVDDIQIESYEVDSMHNNIGINVFPNDIQMYVQDLYPFYPKENEENINVPSRIINPYGIKGLPNIDKGYYLDDSNIPKYKAMIEDFYSYNLNDRWNMPQDFDRYPDDFADLMKEPLTEFKKNMYQNHKSFGCPVVFSLDIPELKISDLQYTSMADYAKRPKEVENNSRVNTAKFKDFLEIEWAVKFVPGNCLDGTKRPETFLYSYRTSIWNGLYFPVFLQYVGYYSVSAKLYDMSGNMTKRTKNNVIQVKGEYPEIVVGYIGDDKFDFTIENLANVKIEDFAFSTAEKPVVNILNNDGSKHLDIQHSLIDTFKIVPWIDKTEVYNFETNQWEDYKQTTNVNREQYGFGDGVSMQANIYKNAQIRDLFHLRACDTYFAHDFVPGFAMRGVKKGDILKIGATEIEIKYDKPKDIVKYLNGKKDLLPKDIMKVLGLYHFDLSYCHSWGITDYDDIPLCDNVDFEQKKFNPEPNVIVAAANSISADACQFVELIGNGELDKDYTFLYQRDSREYAKRRLKEEGLSKYIPLLSLDIPFNEILNLDSVTYESMVEKGYDKRLPILFNENFLNFQTSKFQRENIVVPTFKNLIFFVDNIDRKVEFRWTLKDSVTGKILMMTRGCPYFIWHFDYEGTYDLSYYTKDACGNEYEITNEKTIFVVKKDEYIDNVEKELNLTNK